MNRGIVLMGAPASGKGTTAKILVQRLGVPHVSTGDMLRAARAAGTALGKEAERFMTTGKLVPDEVVLGLVRERLRLSDAAPGFILDGFPRTIPQADALDHLLADLGQSLDHVVQLDVPRSVLVERATKRQSVENRDDDHADIFATRLQQYEAMTAAVLPYYAARGLLRRIDGTGTAPDVTGRILESFGKPKGGAL